MRAPHESVVVGKVDLKQPSLESTPDRKFWTMYVDVKGKRHPAGSVVAVFRKKKTEEQKNAEEEVLMKLVKDKRDRWSRKGKLVGLPPIEEGETVKDYRKKIKKAKDQKTLKEKQEKKKLREETRSLRKKAKEKADAEKKAVQEQIKALREKLRK